MKLWSQDYTRRELEACTGDLRQIADIRLVVLDDGAERGVRAALVRTGSGFDFTVLLDRALDIDTATYNGIPITWQSGTGAAHPSRFEAGPRGWHLNFHGGLLTLCGLTNAGRADPDIDPETGERLPTHGRISNLPAYDVRVERVWSADEQTLWLRLYGTVDEVSLGGYRLRLERMIEVTVGEPALRIVDRVRNLGGLPAPLMILYHCNFGWPLIGPETTLEIPSKSVTPYSPEAEAEARSGAWGQLQHPEAGFRQQAFSHEIEAGSAAVRVAICNPRLRLTAYMDIDARTLPFLTHWKMMGFADYVLGIEPGNCLSEGRVKARQQNRLVMLGPGQTHQFNLEFGIINSGELQRLSGRRAP